MRRRKNKALSYAISIKGHNNSRVVCAEEKPQETAAKMKRPDRPDYVPAWPAPVFDCPRLLLFRHGLAHCLLVSPC
ncbi:unnamed protein product [Caenorhabditis auriculariae]|uniref:Uncharacterized protein n=1 Tax=Caenorhabditis auriculariae TaxID=2777116 RepID=A0A8S1HXD1_9PELO|nr:unnamed protein product [Caenorhabditis auriculariae]